MNLALCFVTMLCVQIKGPSSSYRSSRPFIRSHSFKKHVTRAYPHYIVLLLSRLWNSGAVIKSVVMICTVGSIVRVLTCDLGKKSCIFIGALLSSGDTTS